MSKVQKLKIQVLTCIIAVIASAIALTSSTYAWFISNTSVKANGTAISATTNGFILQIANAKDGIQSGGDDASLTAFSNGEVISPSSTNDLKEWWICQGFDADAKVTSYLNPHPNENGKYTLGSEKYAFVMSEYILYTLEGTGEADVYLNATDGPPIEVSSDSTSTIVKDSMRVAIAVVNGDSEELKIVYAPTPVSGSGNDSNAIADKWTYIDGNRPQEVSYKHIEGTNYIDQNGENWAVKMNANEFYLPDGVVSNKIARVNSNGTKVRVYIWLEGTDADCVNNEATQDNAQYNVTVKFAGVK